MKIQIRYGRTQSEAHPDTQSKQNARRDQRSRAEHQHEPLNSLQRARIEVVAGGLVGKAHGLDVKALRG